MEPNVLNAEMILVMAMIGLAVFLFIVEWLRVDVVAILIKAKGEEIELIRDAFDLRWV